VSTITHWDIGVAVFSGYDADGWLEVQYDAFGDLKAGVQPYEVQAQAGILHRPLDPEVDANSKVIEGKASTVLVAMQGGLGRMFILTDPRVIPLLPVIQKGETLLYSDVGSFLRMHNDGRITTLTTDTGDTAGQDVGRSQEPTGFHDWAPWGTVDFDAYGFRVQHTTGASIWLGYMAGAVPNLETYCTIAADQIELDASLISIGPSGAPQDAVAKVTPMLALLAAIQTALTAVAADLAPVANAGKTNAATLTALGSLITAAEKALSTQTVMG